MNIESAITSYETEGHVNFSAMVRCDVLSNLRKAFVAHFGLDDPTRRVAAEPFDISKLVPEANEVMLNPQLMETARRLLRAREIRVWHDQVIIRPPQGGAETRWHQDIAFWPMKEPTALTCWIPLHAVDGETGCLRFLRGSHKWGGRPSIVPQTLDNIVARAHSSGYRCDDVFDLPMQLGDCDFHHGLVFHGAAPNTSNIYRITYKIIYMDVDSELGPDVFAQATM